MAQQPGTLRRWLARLSLVLAAAAVALLAVFGDRRGITMLATGLAVAVVSLAAGFWFLASRGLRRWLALALVFLSPAAAIAAFAVAGLLWVALVSAAVWLLAWLTARAALAPDPADWRMPEHAPRAVARHPFLIMNPHSGGGKVGRFGLKHQAERLGADVYLMSGPGPVDVGAVARAAVARGADLLGVAGGDGTQALVADVAAEAGLPFMVITAGTRNHFALDLGLDRDNPAACLDALTDGVELWVDLGTAGAVTFVNNASFGAYAEVVQSPAYRGDKVGATLGQLPDLIAGKRGAPLEVRAAQMRLDNPQAVLVSNNSYGTGDIAGLSRRARLDSGTLAVVGVNVASARQAVGLIRGAQSAGLSMQVARQVTVDSAAAQIPAGIDGEAMMLATPVRCSIRPRALRVRVPRNRPGVPAPKARMNWAKLRRLAAPARRRSRAPGADRVRPAYQAITDERDIPARIRRLGARTVVFDIEPLVARWDSSPAELNQGIASVIAAVAATGGVRALCFATNSARFPSVPPSAPAGLQVSYLASARKPLRAAPYAGLPGPGVVVGDQVLTDGILARRIGYSFLHFRPQGRGMPAGPRLLSGLGAALRPLLFGRARRD